MVMPLGGHRRDSLVYGPQRSQIVKILGIDPGSSESGYVVYTPPAPVTIAGKIPNEQMLGMLETAKFDTVVIAPLS